MMSVDTRPSSHHQNLDGKMARRGSRGFVDVRERESQPQARRQSYHIFYLGFVPAQMLVGLCTCPLVS